LCAEERVPTNSQFSDMIGKISPTIKKFILYEIAAGVKEHHLYS